MQFLKLYDECKTENVEHVDGLKKGANTESVNTTIMKLKHDKVHNTIIAMCYTDVTEWPPLSDSLFIQ
jgi:hypothetical protein